MKKVYALLICSVLVIGACNKNKKFNKTLDGSWITVTQDGQAVSASDAETFNFSKNGKDDGSVTITSHDNGTVQATYTGTYKVSDKGKTLTIDATDSGTTFHATGSITDQDDKKFTYNATLQVSTGGIFGFNGSSILVLNKQ